MATLVVHEGTGTILDAADSVLICNVPDSVLDLEEHDIIEYVKNNGLRLVAEY